MPGPRQPTDVLKANGRKHMTQAEEDAFGGPGGPRSLLRAGRAARLAHEAVSPGVSGDRRNSAAGGLYAELDRDVLGQFLVSETAGCGPTSWLPPPSGPRMRSWPVSGPECRAAISSSAGGVRKPPGLSVSSRCRLVVPPALATAAVEADEVDEFTQALRARQARAAGK